MDAGKCQAATYSVKEIVGTKEKNKKYVDMCKKIVYY